jgi:Predicted integral membrane protein (DUF2269)
VRERPFLPVGRFAGMVYDGGYAVLLVLHLLAVVFLIGPLALTAVHSPGQARRGDAVGLAAAAKTNRVYAGLSVLVVVFGALMVADRWETSQAWVVASYALWFAAVLLHVLVVGKAQEAALAALARGEDVGSAPQRMAVGAGLATLAWASIIVLMVLKPGV